MALVTAQEIGSSALANVMTVQVEGVLGGESYVPPHLPLQIDLEPKIVLRKVATARSALAELKGAAGLVPNEAILLNTLALQEAKDSSAIENIVTTHDELFRSDAR